MASKPVELWSVDEVVAYLEAIDLGDLAPKIREHDVQGEDLLSLTDSELKVELEITRLQARRIKRYLEDGGASYQKQADEAPPALPDVTGAIPHAEAPDMVDREALMPSSGSFLRVGGGAPHAAVGIPVAEATPVVHIDEATVKRYGETMELIARLEAEQVTVRLPGAREALSQLEKRLKFEQSKFNEFTANQSKYEQKAEDLEEKWFPGKFLLGKKRAEAKVEKAQGQAEEYAHKVKAAGAVLESLHSQRAGLQAQVTELTAKVRQLQEARQWEESILPQVFAGRAGDARENALEAEVDALVPKLQAARQYQTSYGQAYELMRSGRKQMQQAQELFRSAYGMANMNLIGGIMRPGMGNRGMGGTMIDIAKRAQSQQAAQLCQAACDAIIKARSIIPSMPHIQLDRVRSLRGLNMVGVVFDNVFVDVIARQKVQAAMRAVDEIIPDTVAAERWLEGWLSRVREDLRVNEHEYAGKKAALDAVRREIMHAQVQAQAQVRSAAAPPVVVATVSAAPAVRASAPVPDLL